MRFFIAAVCQTKGSATGLINANSLPQNCADHSTLTSVLNAGFAVVGALAFLMIVIGGFRYILSGGEPTKVAESRRQIIYAAIGLIVVASAAAIVNFVLDKL